MIPIREYVLKCDTNMQLTHRIWAIYRWRKRLLLELLGFLTAKCWELLGVLTATHKHGNKKYSPQI